MRMKCSPLLSPRAVAAYLVLNAAVLCLAGCGREGGDPDMPPPGEVWLIGVEPVQRGGDTGRNLLSNGDFQRWWAGAPGPEGFLRPAPSSTLERPVDAPPAWFAARQIWREPTGALEEQLRLDAGILEAGRRYRLTVIAALRRRPAPRIDLWADDGAGNFENVDAEGFILLQSVPDTVKLYQRVFTPERTARYMVSSSGDAGSAVDWIAWRLTEE